MSKITSSIPIPSRHDHWAGSFSMLSVGESVVVANEYGRVAAYQYGKRNQKRFTTRKVEGGFRVWRIS